MVLVQKWPFFQLFFLGNIGQENVFYDIIEQKKAFLGYKNKKFKKSKNSHFSNGVYPWFWSKNDRFSNLYCLGIIGQENVFYDIIERKNAFLGYKNKKFRQLKNWHFSKAMVLVQKYPFFQLFFWGGNRGQENVFYDILHRKHALVPYKNKKFKKSNNWTFSKGVNP